MSLIDNTYFINEITLKDNSGENDAITRYEPEVLRYLLGFDLYKALLADLNGTSAPTEQRFKDLIDGAEFDIEISGTTQTVKWEGLRNDNKISLISYYVYYQFRNNNESYFTGARQAKANVENAEGTDFLTKYVQIQNLMVDLYGCLPLEVYGYSPLFWASNDRYYQYNFEPSAYNFLLSNLTDYPEWVFKPIQKYNQYGI